MNYHSYSSVEILNRALLANNHKAKRSLKTTLIMSIFGGSFIAIAGLFYILSASGLSDVPYGIKKFVTAIPFTTGFVLVLTAGADLYTTNVLFAVNSQNKTISWNKTIRVLLWTYFGNFIGALLFLFLVLMGNIYMQGDGLVAKTILELGSAKMSRTWSEALALGILCNFLVCLSYWASLSTPIAVGKIIIIILPIAAFVAAGFEHSVANMFILPFAISVKAILPAEIWNTLNMSAADFSHINLYNMFVKNLIPVTIGNFIGGAIMVGGFYYWAFKDSLPDQK